MDKNKNIRKVKESGITLIALVVTIIVLLILAGVTLSIAMDNGGLIGRARSAKTTYMQAEQNDLAALEEYDKYIGRSSDSEQEDKVIQYFMQNNYFKTINVYDNTGSFPNISPLDNARDVLMLNGRNQSDTRISVWCLTNNNRSDLYIIEYDHLQWEIYTDDDNKPINVEKCKEKFYIRNGDEITQNNGVIFFNVQSIYGDNQVYQDFPYSIDKDSCNAKIKIISNGAEIDLTNYIKKERYHVSEGYFECDGINLKNIPELTMYSGENVKVTMNFEGKEYSWSGVLEL